MEFTDVPLQIGAGNGTFFVEVMGLMGNQVLIIEDDKEIRTMLASFLEQRGYMVWVAAEGLEATAKLKERQYDLILMDLMLPYISGEQLIAELRKTSQTPVIVLSAKTMLETRLEVLRLGADDYILKPFDLNEVLVRMEVVLCRSGGMNDEGSKNRELSCGDLKLSLSENSVSYKGQEIALTAKELHLLKLLLENPKKVYTKANLYETVWEDVYYYEDNTINVHISNLRNKLKKATGQDFIETVWGIGYRLKEN